MKEIYDQYLQNITEHREQILDILSKGDLRFGTVKITLHKDGKEFTYERWLHPYQGDWEVNSLYTYEILNNLKKIIKPGTVVIDIGAQAGYMSVAYSLFAKNVISFEPNPAAYEVLEANARLNPTICPYNLAITDTEGVLEFHYSDAGLCNGGFASRTNYGVGVTGHTIPLDVIGVDLNKFLAYIDLTDPISLVKIDAEGHDKDILKSIKPILQKHKPVLITEIYNGLSTDETAELLNTIYELGYKAYDENNNHLDITNLGPEIRTAKDIQQGSGHNLICIYDT